MVFLRTVLGFSRGKASGSRSSYHVAVVPVMGRLFSRAGLLSAASSSRILASSVFSLSVISASLVQFMHSSSQLLPVKPGQHLHSSVVTVL